MFSAVMDMLRAEGLKVYFKTGMGIVRAVDNASFEVKEGESFTFVGESGSGKTVLASAIIRLLPRNAILSGKVFFKGRNLMDLNEDEMRRVRRDEIAYIPQSQSSLNPLLRVGFQCAEALIDRGEKKSKALHRVSKLFEFLGIGWRMDDYPHAFSGGMKQRILLAMGLLRDPDLIIADEPTKGLDANRRDQVVEAFRRLSSKTLITITHDLLFAEKIAERVAVMYCGEIVEISRARKFFADPLHPYSKGLLESLPQRGLKPIDGFQPSLINAPQGCRFRERCGLSMQKCKIDPPMVKVGNTYVRCWIYADKMF
ncbi:ABC transporter ATP-binding protein [Archaeoglobus neptunius]|uniref:ABC transporter ATP-binding protein n=1 Tax=Archaeoglobus neptunius TaxID=2798580 RepID=UPI001E5EBA8D|nr:ABC transporter ATP-binding protein [Archaeoglobus neptunius]